MTIPCLIEYVFLGHKLYTSQPTFTCSKSTQWKQQNNVWNRFKVQWRRSGVSVVNFEQTSHIFLVFSLLTLNKYMPAWFPGFILLHCLETVQIRSFCDLSFPVLRRNLNTEIYSANLCIQSEYKENADQKLCLRTFFIDCKFSLSWDFLLLIGLGFFI